VFELLVYPSHVELLGPIDPNVNSMTDRYHGAIESFMRVRFVDNTRKPLRAEAGINLNTIIEHRVVRILNHEIRPLLPVLRIMSEERRQKRLSKLGAFETGGLQTLDDCLTPEFLGYSMSSLKKRKAVWFFGTTKGSAKRLRDEIGTWDDKDELNGGLAKKPSKWGARVSLAFTESIPVVEISRNEWERRKDYPADSKFPNTDGCGLISAKLCDTINAALVRRGFAVSYDDHTCTYIDCHLQRSRAFQIRFGGVKGVVYAGAKSLLKHEGLELSMLLRDS
jgi:hypothetical protein